MTDYQSIIDKYYPAASKLRDIYLRHCRSVADEALAVAKRKKLPLKESDIIGAAMTHDIGICRTDAPGIECHGELPYICHGIAGGEILRKEGAPEEWARVAERHTGSGLTADEIAASALPLPDGDYMPQTLLERLICYADKFYSKSGRMERKDLERVRREMARFGQSSLDRFDDLDREFS